MSQKIFIALCLFDFIQSIVHLLPSIVYRWPLFVSLLVHAISSFKQGFTNFAAQKMFLSYPFVFLFCKISIKPSFLWHSRDCVIILNLVNLLAIRSSSLTLWLAEKTFCNRKLLSELIDSLIQQKLLAIRSSLRTHWLPHRPTNSLRSGALIRAHCHSDRQTLNLWLTSKLLAIRSSYQNPFSLW